MRRLLKEGIHAGDLEDLVLDTVGIDLFNPKTGSEEEVIVVSIPIKFENAGKDLAGFIDKGAINLLDSEISPGPNKDGNYMVFVEFARDKAFPVNFVKLLNDIKPVVSRSKWNMVSWPNKDKTELSQETLLDSVITDAEEYKSVKASRLAQNESFFNADTARPHQLKEDFLKIRVNPNQYVVYEVIDIGETNKLLEKHDLSNKPIKFDNGKILRLQKMLGLCYNVNNISDKIAVTNEIGQTMLLNQYAQRSST